MYVCMYVHVQVCPSLSHFFPGDLTCVFGVCTYIFMYMYVLLYFFPPSLISFFVYMWCMYIQYCIGLPLSLSHFFGVNEE